MVTTVTVDVVARMTLIAVVRYVRIVRRNSRTLGMKTVQHLGKSLARSRILRMPRNPRSLTLAHSSVHVTPRTPDGTAHAVSIYVNLRKVNTCILLVKHTHDLKRSPGCRRITVISRNLKVTATATAKSHRHIGLSRGKQRPRGLVIHLHLSRQIRIAVGTSKRIRHDGSTLSNRRKRRNTHNFPPTFSLGLHLAAQGRSSQTLNPAVSTHRLITRKNLGRIGYPILKIRIVLQNRIAVLQNVVLNTNVVGIRQNSGVGTTALEYLSTQRVERRKKQKSRCTRTRTVHAQIVGRYNNHVTVAATSSSSTTSVTTTTARTRILGTITILGANIAARRGTRGRAYAQTAVVTYRLNLQLVTVLVLLVLHRIVITTIMHRQRGRTITLLSLYVQLLLLLVPLSLRNHYTRRIRSAAKRHYAAVRLSSAGSATCIIGTVAILCLDRRRNLFALAGHDGQRGSVAYGLELQLIAVLVLFIIHDVHVAIINHRKVFITATRISLDVQFLFFLVPLSLVDLDTSPKCRGIQRKYQRQ